MLVPNNTVDPAQYAQQLRTKVPLVLDPQVQSLGCHQLRENGKFVGRPGELFSFSGPEGDF